MNWGYMMDWLSMMGNMMHWSMMGIWMKRRIWVSILIQLWLRVVWIFMWISI